MLLPCMSQEPFLLVCTPVVCVDSAVLGHHPIPLGLGVHHVHDARLLPERIPFGAAVEDSKGLPKKLSELQVTYR